MTLTAWLDTWLITYIAPHRARSTAAGYRHALAHLSGRMKETELSALDPIDLQREINTLAAQYPRQAQIMHVALHAALSRACKLGRIPVNPMGLVDKPTHQAKEAEILDAAEATAYIQAAMQLPAGPLLVLMMCLGLRRNEARGLKPEDLDADGILHIRRQRTRSGPAPLKSRSSRRDIPLPEPLRAIFDQATGEYLVDVSEKSLRTQHRSALSAAGIEKNVTLHGLRHTCATMAIVQGCALVDVQHLLGHKHIQLTADLYTHAQAFALARCTQTITISLLSSYHTVNLENGARLEIV